MAQHDQLGPLRDQRVRGERFATDLGGQRLRSVGERVRAQERTAPSASKRASHVAAADEAYLHEGSRLAADMATRS